MAGNKVVRSRSRLPRVKWLQRKKAMPGGMAFSFEFIAGDHLISHTVARAVPSAQRGLTSVFGMGTGDPSHENRIKFIPGTATAIQL